MAENIMTYVLDLQENLSAKMKQIGINNEQQLDTWSRVQTQVNSASQTLNTMGRSIGSLSQRVSALRAQREWIPASNRAVIRATNEEIERLEEEIQRLNNAGSDGLMSKWLGPIKQFINPLTIATAGVYKMSQYIGRSKQGYLEESVEVSKLSQVMRNTMGARQGEINSILDLASAQQKLGVVGDETQLSGAQELSTYLTKADSLRKLLPAMNDMLAQQYGLNATQEQAATIGMMLGKVMQGQTGALSRYGYAFTKAQEKILKTGTEAQRAAVLFNVVNEAVGGVNEALAKTPEGILKQQANNMGDLQERVGKLAIQVQATLSPIIAKVGDLTDKVISLFERNEERIMQVVQIISTIVTNALSGIWNAIKLVWNIFSGFINGIREGNPIFIGLATVIGSVTTAIILYNAYAQAAALVSKTIAFFKGIETAAWWANNAAMYANPVMWIIAGIVALIAVIAYVAYTTEGWGKTWENVINRMKLGIELFKGKISLVWLEIKNTFLSGFEVIEKGWYKLKSLWDKESANSGLAELERQRNERVKEIAAAKDKVDAISSQIAAMTVWEVKGNGKGVSDVVGSLKNALGIGTNGQLQAAAGGLDGTNTLSGGGSATNDAIATGGTRNTTINISLKNMIENIVFHGGTKENQSEIERNLAEAIYRVLGMAQTSVN